MVVQWIRTGWPQLLDLFFPNVCLLCQTGLETGEEIVCTGCRLKLPETLLHRTPDDPFLMNRFAGKVPVAFVYAYVYFQKKGPVQKLIHALKYKQRQDVGLALGRWYGKQLKEEAGIAVESDVIVPVPLHPARYQQRGYNQADCFAQGLAEALEIPYRVDLLKRTKKTESQTRKDRMQRWENVGSVFAIEDRGAIENLRILLVDDVLTTGATLEACAEVLLQAGCHSVGILTIAAAR